MASPPSSAPSTPIPTAATPAAPLRPIFLTLLLACPVLALLPPRKLDLYTFSLAGVWVVSAEELTLGGHARARKQRGAPGSSHAAADQVEPEGGAEGWGRPNDIRGGAVAGLRSGKSTTQNGNGDEVEGEGGEKGIRGIAKKLWMGDERPGWQKRRLEKEKEELESGRGYGGIIMDQVREVFPSFAGRREGEEESEGGGEG